MKILTGIDIPFNPFGGSPIIVDDWYSNMPSDIEVLFLTMPPTQNRWWSMKNVHFLQTPKTRDIELYPAYISALTKEVSEIIARFKPDIIHMQHLNFGLSRAFANQSDINIPKIGICHGTDVQIAELNPYFMENMIQIVKSASHLIFPAKNMADDFFKNYKSEILYTVISHGIPDKAFQKLHEHSKGEILKLLYAGRLNHYKGADIAVEALAHTKSKASLDIIGGEDENGYVKKLLKIIQRNNLIDIVKFIPQINRVDLWSRFSHYDAILIPSRELEAFSLTAIEAQAHGLPVIYGNGGGIVDVVGKSGIQIHDNNPRTLAKILDRVAENPKLLQEYRKLGFNNAKQYKLSHQINKLIELSQKLCQKKKSKNMSQEIFQQANEYFGALWSRESVKLVNRDITPADMKNGATAPINYCVSTVGRATTQDGGMQFSQSTKKLLIPLLQQTTNQFIYPSESMHISMIGCTPRKDSMDMFPPIQIEKIKNICSEALLQVNSARITFKGVGVIGNQIFLQGYPHDRNWESARQVVESALLDDGEQPISYPDKFPIHMNIARITDISGSNIENIRDFIEKNRDIEIGTLSFTDIEFVITDFVLSSRNFKSLHTFKLK